jgi:hypothetical protein
MEFPDVIVEIIRAFSRPRFKYFREYNRYVELKYEWPALRTMLQTNPDPVLRLLTIFERVFLELVPAKEAFERFTFKMPFELYKKLERDYYDKRYKLIHAERELHLLLKERYVCRI